MCGKDPTIHPLSPPLARQLIRSILAGGVVIWSEPHALERLAERDISTLDCVNVLRGGLVGDPEPEGGRWRYRVRSSRFVVVVEFLSTGALLVVTAWRIER